MEKLERNAKFIAEIIGVTPKYVRVLAREGKIPFLRSQPQYMFDVFPTLQAYIEYLSEQKQEASPDDSARKAAAEADWKRARADMAQLQLQELEANMHRSEDVEEAFEAFGTTIRNILLSLPGRLAVDTANARTAAESSAIIKEVVYDTLNELSRFQYDPEFYKERVREREGWIGAPEDDEEEYEEEQ